MIRDQGGQFCRGVLFAVGDVQEWQASGLKDLADEVIAFSAVWPLVAGVIQFDA
jgi:hypothetical protein